MIMHINPSDQLVSLNRKRLFTNKPYVNHSFTRPKV